MTHHLELGRRGEELAREYLAARGYQILDSNWRYGHAEVDIIARYRDVLVFIEVKSRTDQRYARPEDAVDEKKQNLLAEAASSYAHKIGHEWEIRFDIISLIIKSPEVFTLDHFEDVFYPGW